MNQIYQTLIAVAIVAGAFFLGRSTTPIPDTEVRIDSILMDSIPKLIEESERYKLLYFKSQEDNNLLQQSYNGAIVRVASLQDGIANLRDSVSKIEPTIFIDSTNNIALNIPLQDYHFEGENYKFGVNAYNATLLYGDVQSRTIYETKVTQLYTKQRLDAMFTYNYLAGEFTSTVGASYEYSLAKSLHLGGYFAVPLNGGTAILGVSAKFSIWSKY